MKDEAVVEALYLKGGGHTSCGVQGKIDQLVASTKDFITQIRMGCSWVCEKQTSGHDRNTENRGNEQEMAA